jgi:sulfate/thiosulfate transport system substrate-binding protein
VLRPFADRQVPVPAATTHHTIAAAALVAAAMCTGPAPGSAAPAHDPVTLAFVGFGVSRAANEAAQAAFAATPEGGDVDWTASYGASGDQSRAVVAGLPADYIHLSIEPDVTRLVAAGLVAPDWDAGPDRGIASRSIVVLVVREGNPLSIRGWADLARDDVDVVTPNPGSSGSARWNVLAIYGSVLAAGGSDRQAAELLARVMDNVATFPGSGRDATTAFLGGVGDVLVSYENEAIYARQQGAAFDYVVPDTTMLIENPAAVTADADPRAGDYLEFVLGDAGQAAFASVGFRPAGDLPVTGIAGTNDPDDPYPRPGTLLTIDDLGGWDEVGHTFFDEETGLVTRLLRDAGA